MRTHSQRERARGNRIFFFLWRKALLLRKFTLNEKDTVTQNFMHDYVRNPRLGL